jgi:citrate lyase beta subunit
VKVDAETMVADLEIAVWPGLRGILLNSVGSAAQVQSACERIAELEAARGMRKGYLQLIVVVGSAAGVWNVRAIVSASERISQVFIDEMALAADLDITPPPDPLLPITIDTNFDGIGELGWRIYTARMLMCDSVMTDVVLLGQNFVGPTWNGQSTVTSSGKGRGRPYGAAAAATSGSSTELARPGAW